MGLPFRRRQQKPLATILENETSTSDPADTCITVVISTQGYATPTPPNILHLHHDMLTDILRSAPRSLRLACRDFRSCIDAGRGALKLRLPLGIPTSPIPAQWGSLLLGSLQLRSLHCNHAPVLPEPCVAVAAPCPSLAALDSSGSNVQADFIHLLQLPHLTSLTLDSCDHLMDLHSLAGLPLSRRLSTLVLSSCLNLFDISAVAEFSALTHLDLTNTLWFSDLRTLAACPRLTSLALSPTGAAAFTDLHRLLVLTALSTLVLTCQEGATISPLALLTQLTALTISHPWLRDISSLALPALVTLDVRLASVTTLQPLGKCGSLTHLSLTGIHHLRSLTPLASCPALTHLHVASCLKAIDLWPLEGCRTLEQLTFTHCFFIYGLHALGLCQSLKTLTLNSCADVFYITNVAHSLTLTSLNFHHCSSVSAFDIVGLLVRQQLLTALLRVPGEKRALAVISVDGKPAAASLIVHGVRILRATAVILLLCAFLAWLQGAHTWACILCLMGLAATTVPAVL